MRRGRWAGVLAGSLLLAACDEGFVRDAPPPVTVRSLDESFDLDAYAYCFGNTCWDDFPPADPPDVGNPGKVVVEFPLSGWSFTAFFAPAEEECERAQRVPLEAAGERRFVLRPVGGADTYDVILFGKGDGDLYVTFRWTTPRDGPLQGPSVRWPCSPTTTEGST